MNPGWKPTNSPINNKYFHMPENADRSVTKASAPPRKAFPQFHYRFGRKAKLLGEKKRETLGLTSGSRHRKFLDPNHCHNTIRKLAPRQGPCSDQCELDFSGTEPYWAPRGPVAIRAIVSSHENKQYTALLFAQAHSPCLWTPFIE